jgi:hypothetical protein
MAANPSPPPAPAWTAAPAAPMYAGAPPIASAPAEPPTTAMVLSIIGGVFILLAGLAELWVGATASFLTLSFLGAGLELLGGLGIVVGLVIILLAVFLHSRPEMHVVFGVLILVLSFVSWLSFFGGFFIGFLLALIGGILAITWKPTAPQVIVVAQPPVQRVCPKCGRVIDPNVKFCPHCGATLG